RRRRRRLVLRVGCRLVRGRHLRGLLVERISGRADSTQRGVHRTDRVLAVPQRRRERLLERARGRGVGRGEFLYVLGDLTGDLTPVVRRDRLVQGFLVNPGLLRHRRGRLQSVVLTGQRRRRTLRLRCDLLTGPGHTQQGVDVVAGGDPRRLQSFQGAVRGQVLRDLRP